MLDGGSGNDTAVFSGVRADHSWVHNSDGSWTVSDLRSGTPDGADTLKNIETLQFGDGAVTIATETVVTPPPSTNTAPVAVNDAYSVAKGKSLTVSALSDLLKNDSDGDGDPLKALLVSGPGKGGLKLNADGSFTYTPSKNFTGTVKFTYEDTDGATDSNLATVTITVGTPTITGAGKGRGSGESIFEDQAPAPRTYTHHRYDGHDGHASQRYAGGDHGEQNFANSGHHGQGHLSAFHDLTF